MLVNQQKIDDVVSLFRKRYPRWSGLSDPRFLKDEVNFRMETMGREKDLLGNRALHELIRERRYSEVLDRVEYVIKATDGVDDGYLQPGDMDILKVVEHDKAGFVKALFDLLHGEGRTHQRLDRYFRYLSQNKLPSRWTFPTYLLMISSPAKEFFVKPTALDWFMKFMDTGIDVTSAPTGEVYKNIVFFMRDMEFYFDRDRASNLFEMLKLVYVCYEIKNGRGIIVNDTIERDHVVPVKLVEPKVSDEVRLETPIIKDEVQAEPAPVPEKKPEPIPEPVAAPMPPKLLTIHPESTFSPLAFEILANHLNGTTKEKSEIEIEKPLRRLLTDVLASLPETIRGLFFSSPRSRFGSRKSHDYCLTSCYRKGGHWQGEPQLFLSLTKDKLEFGFSIDWYMGVSYDRFVGNWKRNESIACTIVNNLLADEFIARRQEGRGAPFIHDNNEIRLSCELSKEKVLSVSRKDLANLLHRGMNQIFPLLQLAMEDDAALTPVVDAALVSTMKDGAELERNQTIEIPEEKPANVPEPVAVIEPEPEPEPKPVPETVSNAEAALFGAIVKGAKAKSTPLESDEPKDEKKETDPEHSRWVDVLLRFEKNTGIGVSKLIAFIEQINDSVERKTGDPQNK